MYDNAQLVIRCTANIITISCDHASMKMWMAISCMNVKKLCESELAEGFTKLSKYQQTSKCMNHPRYHQSSENHRDIVLQHDDLACYSDIKQEIWYCLNNIVIVHHKMNYEIFNLKDTKTFLKSLNKWLVVDKMRLVCKIFYFLISLKISLTIYIFYTS